MAARVERDELLAGVDLEALLTEYAGEPKDNHWSCPSPGHGPQTGDTPPVTVNWTSESYPLWCCHACGAGGTAIDLLAIAGGLPVGEAFALLADRSGRANGNGNGAAVKRAAPKPPQRVPSEAELAAAHERLVSKPDLLGWLADGRGWSEAALRRLGVGSDGKRLVFVVRDAAGEVVQVERYHPRPRDGEQKIVALRGRPRELFPAPESLDGPDVWLVEGGPDAVSMFSMGLPASSIPGANGWKPAMAQRFTGRRVIVCTDHDGDGDRLANTVMADLRAAGVERVRVRLDGMADHDKFDVGDLLVKLGSEDARDWLLGEANAQWSALDRANDPAVPRALPAIDVRDRPIREVTEDAIRALEGANDPPTVFVRSGGLVRVRRDEHGRPMVEQLGVPHASGILDRSADFTRSGKHCAPPETVVKDVLTLGEWPVPRLEAVTETPALRDDGTVIAHPGYDARSGLLYEPAAGLRLPPVSASPTAEEVAAARALVEEAIEDFPFVGDASRAGAVALMLTPVLRPAIRGQVPLALLDATKAGTGKGLLASLVSIVATGRPASVLTTPREEKEWAKTLLALLAQGSTFILLDEAAELRSAALAAALTAPTYQDRTLGKSMMAEYPQRATWAAAGNNIRLGGDLARRCYRIKLDAETARPWKRTEFRHPGLLAWATEHRGELLAALLTLGRAWYAAGCPAAASPKIGGFSEWTETMAGVLAHAGIPGFLADIEALYDEADEEAVAWEAFLRVIHEQFGSEPISAGDLIHALEDDGPLREALPDELAIALARSPASFRSTFGKALSRRNGTRFSDDDGLRVEKAGQDKRSRTAMWRVTTDSAVQRNQRSQRSNAPYAGEQFSNTDAARPGELSTSATSTTSAEGKGFVPADLETAERFERDYPGGVIA